MSFDATQRARSEAGKTNKTPNVVLEIDGVTQTYSVSAVKEIVRIGDDILIGDGFIIGELVPVPNNDDIVSYQLGTTTEISQVLKQDKGEGTTVSRYQVSIVDENGDISSLLTPGEVVEDLLGRRCRLWFGFENSSFKEDYIVIHRGIVDSINSGSGVCKVNIAHPDRKKDAEIFIKGENELTAPMTAGSTVADVLSTSDFLAPVTGPDGSIDSTLQFYIKINDEIMKYEVLTGTQFSTITRGQLGTLAASHSTNDSVESFYRIGPVDAMSVALKILLSGKEGPYQEAVPVTAFNRVDVTDFLQNAIFFDDLDIFQAYNVQVGDFVTVTGSAIPGNNVTNALIESIASTNLGTYIVLSDTVTLTEDIGTTALIDFRSKFDVWPTGAGLSFANDEVDIEQHLQIQRQFLSSFDYDFYLQDTIKGKEFLQSQVYNPSSSFELPRKAQASVGYQSPPLPGSEIVTLDTSNILNANSLRLERSIQKDFYNSVIYKFEELPEEEGKFIRGEVFVAGDSISRIPVGNKPLTIESKGMRESLSAVNNADIAATRRLSKYKYGAETIKGLKMTTESAWTIEIGDAVILDMGSLKITDTTQGGSRSGNQRLFDVTNKKFNTKTGVITLDLSDTNANKNVRFGLISQCSQVKFGNSTTEFVIEPNPTANTDRFGADEWRKWASYVGAKVNVRNSDYSITDTSTLLSIVGNTITLDTALAFTPLAGYVIELAKYTDQPDNIKVIFGFMNDTDFPDSGKQYAMF